MIIEIHCLCNRLVFINNKMFVLIPEELQNVRESEGRYKQQFMEAQRRERMLIRRLAAKEQEMQDYAVRYGGSPFANHSAKEREDFNV